MTVKSTTNDQALLSAHAAKLFSESPPGEPSAVAGALANLLLERNETETIAAECDTLRAALAAPLHVDFGSDPTGRLVANVTGRGEALSVALAEEGSRAVVAEAAGRLVATNLRRQMGG